MTALDVAGKRVVVAGIGVSGVPVAEVLLDRGAKVMVVDGRDGDGERAAAEGLRARGADVRLGDAESPVDADLVVTSPGWRPTQPLLASALREGVEVIGEPELAARLARERHDTPTLPWLAVTGTNGKTTTVGMLESVLRAAGHRTVAAGNVGLPLVSAVLADPGYDVLAVELSSFQLHWSTSLRMRAAAVLNVAEDHLDWHGSMADYAADKAKIWAGTGCAVFNADDEWSSRLSAALTPRVGFTLGPPPQGQFGLRDGVLVAADGSDLLPAADLPVPGPHNIANALAAAALATAYGVEPAAVAAGLHRFAPGHHRNEVVAIVDGVTYVDDSKATNPHAAAASLAAYPTVVWLAGGLLKGADVGPLVAAQAARLRAVVLLGRDRQAIADALARHAPDVPVVDVAAADTEGMDEAVRLAAGLARPGDTVLLAPAAASMDMFRDYAERGDRFAAAAQALAGRR